MCVSLIFIGVFVFTYMATEAGRVRFESSANASTKAAAVMNRVDASDMSAALTMARSKIGGGSLSNTNAKFSICHTGGGINCVVDGDTAWIGGEKVRVADIDAPETHPPRCSLEANLGEKATKRLAELMNDGPFDQIVVDRDRDRYGRKLRILTRNGKSLGQQLVAEGLARSWEGRRRPWC